MKFSKITFPKSSLKSRITRTEIGQRFLDFSPKTESGGGWLGWLGQIFDPLIKFAVSLVKIIFAGIQWTFSSIWEWCVEAYYEIKYFDWNQTDADLQEEIDNNNIQIAGAAGNFIGQGLAWLTGYAISSSLKCVFPVVSGYISSKLLEEGTQEMRNQLSNLVRVSAQAESRNFWLGTLLTARRLRLFGMAPVKQKREPWTIAEAIDKTIEKISGKNKALKAFLSQAVEGFEEGIIEMGFVVANHLDDYVAMQKSFQSQSEGPVRKIEIVPNKLMPQEKLTFVGAQTKVRNLIETTLSTHTLVHNRDVGLIVGTPIDDYERAKKLRRKLHIVFKGKKEPPWIENGERTRTVEFSLPDVKEGLSWDRLKATIPSFTYGEFRTTCYLDNGRQLAIYAASDHEGESVIKALLQISTAEIKRIYSSRVSFKDAKYKKKTAEIVYPAFAVFFEDDERLNTKKKRIRIPLWPKEEPYELEAQGLKGRALT